MPGINFQKIKAASNALKQESKLRGHLEELGEEDKQTIFTLKKGDPIVVTEKIDGANASIYHTIKNGEHVLELYSRHKRLKEDNTLNGFYGEVMKRKEQFIKAIPVETQVYGEWLTSHVVKYKPECYHKWYVYDAINHNNLTYLGYKDTINMDLQSIDIVEKAPLLYEGKYQYQDLNDLDKLRDELITNSKLSADGHMEGIVLTDYAYPEFILGGSSIYGYYRVKDVDEAYREISKNNNSSKKDSNPELDKLLTYVGKGLNLNRVRKEVLKMQDEDGLDKDITFAWMRNGNSYKVAENVLSDIKEEIEDKPDEGYFLKYEQEVLKFVAKEVNKFVALTVKKLI